MFKQRVVGLACHHFVWGLHSYALMRSCLVVHHYGIVDGYACINEQKLARIEHPLVLDCIVYTLCHGVVKRVARLRHTYPYTQSLQSLHVSCGGILHAPV